MTKLFNYVTYWTLGILDKASSFAIQFVDREKYHLTIDGLVSNPVSYTYQQLFQFPSYQKAATLQRVEG